MPTDRLSSSRTKTRWITELRHPGLIKAFDRRGQLLENLYGVFKQKMQHWRVENVTVTLLNDFNNPTRQLLVDHKRSAIIYEDPGSVQEFVDDSKHFLQHLLDIFPDLYKDINRIGVRSLSILKADGCRNYDEALARVMTTFFAPKLPLDLPFSDCRAILIHPTGHVSVGPVQKGEEWISESFTLQDERIPDFGFGIDIDSAVKEPSIGSKQNLINSVNTVIEQTTATEYEIAVALGVGKANV
jgi:hypothetical protein